jgi:anti-anti-sigma factor
MDVIKSKDTKAIIAAVKGRVDTVTAPAFEKKIAEVMEGENIPLLLDFRELEYISSAGLRSILIISKEMKTKGSSVYISGLQGNAKEVFNISGFSSIFKIFETKEDALITL